VSLVADNGVVAGFLLSLLVVGPVVLGLVLARRPDPVPVGGIVALTSAFLVMAVTGDHSWQLLAGTAVAGVGGFVGATSRLPAVVRIALVVPGAAIAVLALPYEGAWWYGPAGIAAASAAGPAVDVVEDRYRRTGLAVVMLGVSVGGVYGTIPNTDRIALVFGAVLPVMFLAWPRPWARVGAGAGSAAVVLLAALTLNGGWTRPGAVVGGLLAPAVFVLLALAGRPDGSTVARAWPPLAVRLLVLDVVVTLGLTRVAGLEESARTAIVLAAPMLVGGWWVARRFVAGRRLATWQAAVGLVAVAAVATALIVRLVSEEPGPDTSRSCPDREFVASPGSGGHLDAPPVHDYPLDEGEGTLVADATDALDLTIGHPASVAWDADGGLAFEAGGALVASVAPAGDLASAVAVSDEVTVEAWFAPSELPQEGPARVLTVSGGPAPDEVNVHLGVEDRGVSFRVRTDCDLFNWTRTGDVLSEAAMHHVVATYRPGEVAIWVDGALETADRTPVGLLDDWDPTVHLYLGDEATADRPFLGTIRQAAVYDRALTEAEVVARYEVGP
jgi:hypothetical protein